MATPRLSFEIELLIAGASYTDPGIAVGSERTT
jgi:hypothetical protein